MPLTPVGAFALPSLKLRRMVSLCDTFKNAYGSTALALERIYTSKGDPCTPDTPRPFALVSMVSCGADFLAGGIQNELRTRGMLELQIQVGVPDEYLNDADEAEVYATNFLGQIHDELVALSGADDTGSADGTSHLAITSLECVEAFEIPRELWVQYGRFWLGIWRVEWGDGR